MAASISFAILENQLNDEADNRTACAMWAGQHSAARIIGGYKDEANQPLQQTTTKGSKTIENA